MRHRSGVSYSSMLHYVLYVANGLVMLALPLALATGIARRYGVQWGLFGIGAATFVGSKLLHLPVVALLQPLLLSRLDPESVGGLAASAAFLGLAAGLFEESARYLTYRYWARDARSWRKGLMLGAGHGGVEAILLALFFFANIAFLAGLRAGLFSQLLPAEMLASARERAEILFTVPWPQTILGALERVSALALHLALSIMVLFCFTRRRFGWFWLAVGWHALVDAVALISLSLWGPYVTEGLLLLLASLSLLFVFAAREHPAVQSEEPVPPAYGPPGRIEIEVSAEKVEQSRYE